MHYTVQKLGVRRDIFIFLNEIHTFIQQGCIKLIKDLHCYKSDIVTAHLFSTMIIIIRNVL